MIVDCHCHAGRGDGFTGPWDTSASLASYIARAREAGIERTVLFAAFHTDYRAANRWIAALIRAQPHRFSGFAFIDSRRDEGRIGAMVAEAVELGLVGIKTHRYNARISRELCDAALEWGLPVLYDVMGEVSSVPLFAGEYPEIDFIIPHLGSFADDWAAQMAFIDHLARLPNVYTDSSGVRRFDLLEEAVQRAGASKVLFGSDGPWLHPAVELAKVRALRLSSEDRALVEGGNILRLIERPKRDTGPVRRSLAAMH